MEEKNKTPLREHETSGNGHNVDDLNDMLSGLRVMLPSAQLLTAFLLTLPFNAGFAQVVHSQKWTFLATFLCSLTSLVMLSAPAIQHRLMRPLRNRVKFKQFATREILIGSLTLSLALILGTHLVTAEVFGDPVDNILTAFVASLIVVLWWLLPRILKAQQLM